MKEILEQLDDVLNEFSINLAISKDKDLIGKTLPSEIIYLGKTWIVKPQYNSSVNNKPSDKSPLKYMSRNYDKSFSYFKENPKAERITTYEPKDAERMLDVITVSAKYADGKMVIVNAKHWDTNPKRNS